MYVYLSFALQERGSAVSDSSTLGYSRDRRSTLFPKLIGSMTSRSPARSIQYSLKLCSFVELERRLRCQASSSCDQYPFHTRFARSAVFTVCFVMSFRMLLSKTLGRPALLRHCSVSAECPLVRHYSVLVEGSGQADGKALPLLAQARMTVSSESSDTKPKAELVVERKILAYPPTHYFDTHKVVTALQQAGKGRGLWLINPPRVNDFNSV